MQFTPVKGFITKNSSLRAQIEKKLLTDKKLDNNKENLKKYNSHVKNTNQNNFFSCQNHQTFQTIQIDKTHYQNLDEFHSESIIIEKSLIDEKAILQYESLENPNFYGYSEWQQLNHKLFSYVEQKYMKNLWKIMRTINYGDALIPTGLIFQVIQNLISKQINKAFTLKEILNKFLQINNASDRINNFRQLKNYLTLQQIQKGYGQNKKMEKRTPSLKSSIYKDLQNSSIQKNVFDRNYEDYRKRNLTKNQAMQKRLIQKQLDPQCLFKPQINQYCPKKLFNEEQLRPSRKCHSNGKWMTQKLTNNEFSQNSNFRATPFQRSRLQCQSLEEIPGATQHIDRYKNSDAKKRRINRYKQRPTQVFRNY